MHTANLKQTILSIIERGRRNVFLYIKPPVSVSWKRTIGQAGGFATAYFSLSLHPIQGPVNHILFQKRIMLLNVR
jgi:hypothetical protein